MKKDIRLQVFITEQMDNQLTELAEIMGLSKQEIVRVATAQYCASVNIARSTVGEALETALQRGDGVR